MKSIIDPTTGEPMLDVGSERLSDALPDETMQSPADLDVFAQLNQGQRACLRLVTEKRTSKDIARILNVSPHTVDMRIRNAMRILAAPSRAAAALALANYEMASQKPAGQNENFLPHSVHAQNHARTDKQIPGDQVQVIELETTPPSRPWGTVNRLLIIQRLSWMAAIVGSSIIIFSMIVSMLKAIKDAI